MRGYDGTGRGKLTFKKLALLTEDVAYCQSDITMVQTALTSAGVTPVFQTFSATALDISPTQGSLGKKRASAPAGI